MTSNNRWRFIIVLVVVAWAFLEMYPPLGRNLGDFFKEQSAESRRDAAYTNIVQAFDKLQAEHPQNPFNNLVTAVGTNDLTKYFPQYSEAASTVDPSRAVLNDLQKGAAGKIRLGLDLVGGTRFVVELDTNYLRANSTNLSSVSLDQRQKQAQLEGIEVLRRRVDKFGVSEPVIQAQGSDRIVVELPGLSDADKERAIEEIKKAAHLELRMVHPQSEQLIRSGIGEPGYEILVESDTAANGVVSNTPVLVKKKAEMTGQYITFANVHHNDLGQPEINFTLDDTGRELFGKLTTDHVHERMAIVLDGVLLSAPNIIEPILGGSCRITGSYTEDQAQDLANALQNPLSTPLILLSSSSVDPTLGAATVRSGVTSAVIGTLLVAGFMIAYYLFAGAVADVALITNIIILLGVMCYLPATFTLPGIAGVVLTIGMAVDANVLIFERIREESAKGKSLRGALAAGYDRAFGTIFDSHVTTLISSIILIYKGTGPIKGFGVTLTIGVAASLFTALVVTRLIFDFLIGRGWLKALPMLHIIRATKLDFMKLAKPAFILSWTIIILGLSYGIFVRGNKMMGIDFKGGDSTTLSFNQKISDVELRAALKKVNINDPGIQFESGTNQVVQITSEYGTGTNVLPALTASFPAAKFVGAGSEVVGATVGTEIQEAAIVASLLSLLGILLYVAFRYEFSFAVGAVVAVLHDVLMTIGCYCLTGLFGEGRQFNATMVAAVLTIIGFSINDTIVIFDRIREDLKLGVRGSFKELINQALNQTLSRTIITSGTVFLATSSLYLFGGGAINDFAFTFLVGIITGTYSSIYIASALVLWWHKGARPRTSNARMAVENTAAAARP